MSIDQNQVRQIKELKSQQSYHILLRVKYTLQVGISLERKYIFRDLQRWTFIYLRIHRKIVMTLNTSKRVYEVLFFVSKKYI